LSTLLKKSPVFPNQQQYPLPYWAHLFLVDMRLQIEPKSRPQHASRLNGVVFGVALLWLATSVLLLMLVWTGSTNERQRKDSHQQLARVHQTAATASFRY
jgi:hypothetical protein